VTRFFAPILAFTRVISVAISEGHCLAVTAEGTVFSWACGYPPNRDIDALGHCDPGDFPYEYKRSDYTPRAIETLAGQRIRSVSASTGCSMAVGWADQIYEYRSESTGIVTAREVPATSGEDMAGEKRQQWACWTWGRVKGRCLPQRVIGVGKIG
jgi:hypothetical protein